MPPPREFRKGFASLSIEIIDNIIQLYCMKSLAYLTAIVASGLVMVIAAYALYEMHLEGMGEDTLGFYGYREGLISSLNFALPSAVICILFLLQQSKSNPVDKNVIILVCCLIFFAGYLAIFAGKKVFSAQGGVNSMVWWMPESPQTALMDP